MENYSIRNEQPHHLAIRNKNKIQL